MRITRSTPSARPGATRAAAPARGRAPAAFTPAAQTDAGAAASGPAGPSGVGALGSVDALLAVQAAEPTSAGGALARGERILDSLDSLRLALLEGRSPAAAAKALQDEARARREAVEDQGLASVLDAVDVRAAVELAKLERGRARA